MRWTSIHLAVALGLGTAGCASSTKLLGTTVKQSVAVVFRSTEEVATKADRRSMRVMADTLLTGMRERGVSGYMPPSGADVPAPRIELFVKKWELTGGRKMSDSTAGLLFGGVIGAAIATRGAAHSHDAVVDCSVYRTGDKVPAFRHVFNGDTAHGVANQILDRVFTERTGDTGQDPAPATKK
jgi:hypothetical protein